MRHVVVTGGAGFIGSNFVHHLLESYSEIAVSVIDCLTYAGNLENLKRWEKDKRFKFYKVDIVDSENLKSTLQKIPFTEIAHFAAESHVDRSILGPEAFVKTNVMGTFHLLEIFRQKYSESKNDQLRFLHVSTDEVFGSLGSLGSFTESSPYQPNSPYSASKAGSDHLVRSYFHTYHLPVLTTNCSNNYGPYHFPEKLIPLTIVNCLHGKPLPVYGKGHNIRDWLYVLDHCSAIDAVLLKGKIGETYNIGTRNEIMNIEIVTKICKIMDELHPSGKPHESLIQFVKDRPGHDFRYSIDPSKIEKEIGWKPKFSFDTALRNTIEWYLQNRSWWENILSGDYKNYYSKQYSTLDL